MIKKQQGFSLMASLFILVILSLASAFVVSIAATTNATTGLSLRGLRANSAARAGIEWALTQLTSNPNACPATTNLSLTQSGLNGFTVTVSCSYVSFVQGVKTNNVFTITSVGKFGTVSDADYVARSLEAVVSKSI